jgi:hypothetical protein
VRPRVPSSPPPEDWATIDLSDVMKGIEKKTGVKPDEQFAAVYAVWAANVPVLKVVFRFFCLQVAWLELT